MKELENDADNIRNGKNSKSSKRGVKMGKGKKMNIIEEARLAKKAKNIEASFGSGMHQAKSFLLRGISLGTALSIIMSSVAFGGTHYMNLSPPNFYSKI